MAPCRYDTNVKTVLEGVTFRNYRWKGNGANREAVWITMTHSDKCASRSRPQSQTPARPRAQHDRIQSSPRVWGAATRPEHTWFHN